MYTDECTFESRNDCDAAFCAYHLNCCGPSAWVRVNQSDWDRLRDQGKLDGIRYQQLFWSGESYTVQFKKMVGTAPALITSGQFLP
ncbi:hypothetical protein DRW03_34875 [Corallococcus sp. H22C18031201]|uniref:hypothetical protein n=1 Tax=Citreicoccus inhibens TaxID=2849499 RepID=UPI000E75E562|nr:hypothetical protein [Citreicoccus inhibens]MBU8900691.1 hypothetical protein [Citreicoccus inhibens]RJS14514.1 hypothetical protein DRW03_34875 [Corallococcus sp. H22C18031201]